MNEMSVFLNCSERWKHKLEKPHTDQYSYEVWIVNHKMCLINYGRIESRLDRTFY
jgi:hypothetical protein